MEITLENFDNGNQFTIEVGSLEDARHEFVMDRDSNNVGMSDYSHKSTGEVRENGKKIATISYNGRIWEKGSLYF